MSPKELCDLVLKHDRDIKYAGVIDGAGRLQAESSRGLPVFRGKSEGETGYLLQGVIAFKMARDAQDATLGSTELVYVRRKKTSQFSIPLDERVLFVSMQREAPFRLVDSVVKKVNSVKKKLEK
jgi:hypothetical protein